MAAPVTDAQDTQTPDTVRTEVDGTVARIVLTAARRRNPLSVTTMRGVTAALRGVAAPRASAPS